MNNTEIKKQDLIALTKAYYKNKYGIIIKAIEIENKYYALKSNVK